jgi:nitrate reductase cytochrome c-type subunit
MGGLACLNCHTDRTRDLRPGRNKCLYCHGTEAVRKEMISAGSMDVRHYAPSEETVKKAIKVKIPDKAPMQFYCYECHHPHQKDRPDWGNCLGCHQSIPNVGKHSLHIQVVGMKCKDCHKPHGWRVTEEIAKKECVKCHEYREPKKFIGGA